MACHLWSLDQTRSPDSWPIVLSVAPPYLSRGDLFETLSRVLWQWQWHVITWVWSMCSPWTWPFGYYVLFSLLSSLPAESVEQQGRVLRCQTSASFFCAFANTLEQKGLFPRSVCLFSSLWPPLLVGPWFWNSLGIASVFFSTFFAFTLEIEQASGQEVSLQDLESHLKFGLWYSLFSPVADLFRRIGICKVISFLP